MNTGKVIYRNLKKVYKGNKDGHSRVIPVLLLL